MKIGDKVMINIKNRSRLTDCQADLISNLTERCISSDDFDCLNEALRNRIPCEIIAINEGDFEIKIKKSSVEFPFCFNSSDLELI